MSTIHLEPDAETAGGVTMSATYEQDFYAWTQRQAALLKAGRLSELDRENLIEEIESMGRGEQRELASRIKVLLQHLLKWEYQPAGRSSGWIGTIEESRDQIDRLLKQSPSLRRQVPEAIAEEYPRARRDAGRETGLGPGAFPEACPYAAEEVLAADFWPGKAS